MDFSWPSEYLEYKTQLINFARQQLNAEDYSNTEFSRKRWESCAEFGIQGLAIPAAYGGKLEKVDFQRAMLAMEGFGYGCHDTGLAFALNAQMWTVQTPIVHFANEVQKQKYLVPMSQGKMIGAHGLTEPNAGSDIFSMETTAVKTEEGYLINGKKHLITMAPICDFVLLFANAKPELGRWGVSAFLVDKGTPGFTTSKKKKKMGLQTVPIGDLEFENCLIPHENLVGSEGLGFSIMNHSLEYDRCCIMASQLGTMERQLENTIAFVKKRKQFGKAVGKFQSVSNRIADMKLRMETSRLLLYKTAWLKENGTSAMLEAALLKLHLSESFVTSSIDAMRSFGGSSYLEETGVEQDLRDAIGGILYAGTSDIQRNIISKLLGL